MFDFKYLLRLDFRIIPILILIMTISLLVISSMTNDGSGIFFTYYVKSQLKWFFLGWGIFLACSALNYAKIREWTWFLYLLMLFMLIGLFFSSPVQNVHRWYKIPLIGMNFQPSEYAKLIVVITLGWFLEKNAAISTRVSVAFKALLLGGVPFFLILKQPDLGTALILLPILLVMVYLGNTNKTIVRIMLILGFFSLILTALIYLNIVEHEDLKPFFLKFLKEYQYERLNPNTYHQRASQTAIAIGGMTGAGWNKSDFSSKKWLPASHTDSVFSAYGEEFGFLGIIILILLYSLLIGFSFRVSTIAKDYYGRLLSSGLAVYLSMHILVNIGMMCGILPISGVPLILITYGGNSILTTMGALGILQSIYSRRFMF
jgi:rod shape determining protein RodA